MAGDTVAAFRGIQATVIALAVLAATTVLGLHGTLSGEAVTGILGAVVGLAGGAGAAKIGGEIRNGS